MDQVWIDKARVLPNLTSIRLFAALYVLIFHQFNQELGASTPWLLRNFVAAGYEGVSLFFVLSGFILAYVHPEVSSKRRFYAMRFARVYPLYFAALLWMVPHQVYVSPTKSTALLIGAHVLVLQSWYPPIALTLNVPGWTLSVEVLFYASFPFLIGPLRRRVDHWRALIFLIWTIWLIPPVLVNYLLPRLHAGSTTLSLGHALLATPPARLGEFGIGILLGLDFRRRQPVVRGHVVLAALLLTVGLLELNGLIAHEVMRDGLMALPFGILVYAVAGWKSPWMGSRQLQFGGEVSFGIYLLQVPIGSTLAIAASHLLPKGVSIPWYVNIPACVTIPALVYLFFEVPARNRVLCWFGIRSHKAPIPLVPMH